MAVFCRPGHFGSSREFRQVGTSLLQFNSAKKGSAYLTADVRFRGGSRGRVLGVRTPPEMTCGFLIQLVFCKKKTMWFIGVEIEQETSAPPPKKNPGSAPEVNDILWLRIGKGLLLVSTKIDDFIT